jgi:hypothetical protein
MGKRSAFPRRPMDDYATPHGAVLPLVAHLRAEGIHSFAEPCCGNGELVRHLERLGFKCVHASDIRRGVDALSLFDIPGDAIITNPPWTRDLLHDLIEHFRLIKPTWLLFDADWAHTRQSAPLIRHCSHIVAIGRQRWIPDSPFTGKDNAAWHRFAADHCSGPHFVGRSINSDEFRCQSDEMGELADEALRNPFIPVVSGGGR